jgi:ABC-2 type transport system permease protein
MFLGLPLSVNIIFAILASLPVSVLQISLGLLFGSILNVKQVGGICGGLLINLSAWLSGVWFDLDLVGGAFKDIAHLLPFAHAVELNRSIINGSFDGILSHLGIVSVYGAAITFVAVLLFLRQMKRQ